MSRWVLVDDSDPAVQYTGSWFQNEGTLDNFANFGPPYLSTLHGTNSSGSFSYPFRGSKVLITGTVQFPDPSGTNPSWECVVDGVSTPSIPYSIAENRLRLCEVDGLVDTPHTITVKATSSNQRTFWFDYIQYLPYASASLDNAALSIDSSDTQFQYNPLGGTGWRTFNPGYVTSQTGSTFTFDFNGVSLTWLGFYDKTLPMTPTTATYSVDGQTPTTFDLNGLPANATGIQYNQIFFQVGQLAPGDHKLQVVYQGNSQTTPLSLYILEVQNGDGTSTNTSPPSGSNGSITTTGPVAITGSTTPTLTIPGSMPSGLPISASDSANNKSSNNIAVIIGGAVGGFALLCLFVLAFFLLHRRKRRAKIDLLLDMDEPVDYPVAASIVSPFNPGGHFTSSTIRSYSHPLPTDTESSGQRTSVDTPPPVLMAEDPSTRPSMMTFRNEKSSMETPYLSHSSSTSPRLQSNRPLISQSQKELEHTGPAPPIKRAVLRSSLASSDDGSSTVARDEDSGLRFRPPVELMPPRYTAQ